MLDSQPADVVLLDIRMPEMDGIEFAEHLRKLPDPPIVIFTTAYDAYAIKAFELHAVDYLVKPIRLGRLFDALNRVRQFSPLRLDVLQQMKPEPRSHLSVQERGRVHLVPIKEIIYLKAELKYVTIRTAQREYLIEESLTRLEEEFTEQFLRIHRNCLVGRAFVTGFERVTNDNGDGHWVVTTRQRWRRSSRYRDASSTLCGSSAAQLTHRPRSDDQRRRPQGRRVVFGLPIAR